MWAFWRVRVVWLVRISARRASTSRSPKKEEWIEEVRKDKAQEMRVRNAVASEYASRKTAESDFVRYSHNSALSFPRRVIEDDTASLVALGRKLADSAYKPDDLRDRVGTLTQLSCFIQLLAAIVVGVCTGVRRKKASPLVLMSIVELLRSLHPRYPRAFSTSLLLLHELENCQQPMHEVSTQRLKRFRIQLAQTVRNSLRWTTFSLRHSSFPHGTGCS